MYIEELTAGINKALRDEISSSMLYKKLAEQSTGPEMEEFAEQLAENGDEEYEHFKEILTYATNHGIKFTLSVDPVVIGMELAATLEANVNNIVNLENIAYNDYKNLALCARKADDIETEAFFIELMNDERKHIDGLLKLSKVQPPKPTSFREYLQLSM